ncbi:MAG: galactose-1-phosphate uridylyltransferase [Planctomycetes bacterium]|nr:galactose-1-phosphate uridylyltransferase [Planctomycetota bacterium]
MSEYRHDPVNGHWVILADNRSDRPDEYIETGWERISEACPFCEGNEGETPPEIARYAPRRGRTWLARVVPNKYPAVAPGARPPIGRPPPLEALEGYGVHEVVIESPRHLVSWSEMPIEGVRLTCRAYQERLAHLRRRGDLVYGVVFKNVGPAAGASIEHVHGQVLATALLPPPIAVRLAHWREGYHEAGRTVVSRWLDDERRDGARVVAETRHFAAVCPFASRVPYEVRIAPLEPMPYYEAIPAGWLGELASLLRDVVRRIERASARAAYNLIIHTAPFDAGPHDHFHWHIEILPRLTRAAGFEWGTGCFINPLLPETAASRLRAPHRTKP